MSLLRNLAVLVIFTVAVLSLTSRPVAAQSSCTPAHQFCHSPGITLLCCTHYCSPLTHRCCHLWPGAACTYMSDCCSGVCQLGYCR